MDVDPMTRLLSRSRLLTLLLFVALAAIFGGAAEALTDTPSRGTPVVCYDGAGLPFVCYDRGVD